MPSAETMRQAETVLMQSRSLLLPDAQLEVAQPTEDVLPTEAPAPLPPRSPHSPPKPCSRHTPPTTQLSPLHRARGLRPSPPSPPLPLRSMPPPMPRHQTPARIARTHDARGERVVGARRRMVGGRDFMVTELCKPLRSRGLGKMRFTRPLTLHGTSVE